MCKRVACIVTPIVILAFLGTANAHPKNEGWKPHHATKHCTFSGKKHGREVVCY